MQGLPSHPPALQRTVPEHLRAKGNAVHTRSNKIAVSVMRLGSAFLNRLYAGASMRGYAGADDFRLGNSGLIANVRRPGWQ
jgi:hypothetical protein